MAMTSIYYTECGHWGRRNLSGSSRSRERYVESLGEGELYPDYKREALLKKREAVKVAEEKIWPDLLGSEKQIAWATTIRAQVVNGVVSLKRLLNQSILKSWSSKMIKKSLEAYFFTLKNKIVFCKKQFQNMSVFCFVSTEIV